MSVWKTWHTPSLQQPRKQVNRLQKFTPASPPPSEDELLDMQEPPLQALPVSVQSRHAPPPFPHAVSSIPAQRPLVSQQPVLQDWALQGTLAS